MTSQKFIFERDFDREIEIESGLGPEPERVYSEAEMQALLEAAREDGFAQGQDLGYRTGRAEAIGQAEKEHHATLDALTGSLQTLMRGEAEHRVALERDVVVLMTAILEHVLPEAKAALSVERLEREILAHLRMGLDKATLKIRMNPEDRERIEATIRKEADKLGLTELIEVIADAGLAQGATRVDWNDGFMEFGFERICAAILDRLKAQGTGHEQQKMQAHD